MKINRAKRKWTLHPKYVPTFYPCEQWPIGSTATMVDCYGRNAVTGRVVEHSPQGRSLTLSTRGGLISGGVSLMLPPGEVMKNGKKLSRR